MSKMTATGTTHASQRRAATRRSAGRTAAKANGVKSSKMPPLLYNALSITPWIRIVASDNEAAASTPSCADRSDRLSRPQTVRPNNSHIQIRASRPEIPCSIRTLVYRLWLWVMAAT